MSVSSFSICQGSHVSSNDCRDTGLKPPLLNSGFNHCSVAGTLLLNHTRNGWPLSISDSHLPQGDQLITHVDDVGGSVALAPCCGTGGISTSSWSSKLDD